ncbi:MAG: hypothetical protein HFI93_09255 [Lachnospiraceae bacterium]|nr:hypothetical protein [Lachnospiraceae bacterium]
MESYVFIGLAVLAGLFFLFYTNQRRARKMRRIRIEESWGKLPDREYTYDEFERIRHYFDRKADASFALDEITWQDLDLDSVFRQMNHTWSSVGEETLYRILRTPTFDEETLRERDRLATYFASHKKETFDLQEIFCELGRVRRIALADYLYSLPQAPKLPIGRSLFQDILFAAAVFLLLFNISAGIPLFILMIAVNILTYYQNRARVESYFSCVSYLLKLLHAGKRIAQKDLPELKTYQETIRKNTLPFRGIEKKAALISGGDRMGGSFLDMLLDYIRMITHVDLIAFEQIRRQLERHIPEMESVMEPLGQIESAVATASYRESLPCFCRPDFSKGDNLCFAARRLYHPLLTDPVTNDFKTGKGVLLTGSNASGKSTFLKTAALAAVLAQTIATVPAASYQSSRFLVYSSMSLKDDLAEGESYYMAEIRSLKRILDAAGGKKPILCFVDEVLRGTNTVERIAASAKLLQSLAGKNALPFAATHDRELTGLLKETYENYHFEEEMREGDIAFSYRILPGPATTCNAIRLLARMGYATDVTAGADRMAEHFLQKGVWENL